MSIKDKIREINNFYSETKSEPFFKPMYRLQLNRINSDKIFPVYIAPTIYVMLWIILVIGFLSGLCNCLI